MKLHKQHITKLSLRLKIIAVVGILLLQSINISCSGEAGSGDTEPPKIVSFYPARGQDNVPINTQIAVTFNKSVININQSTFYLEKLNETGKIPASINYDDASKTATLKPLKDLDYNAIYYVTLTSSIRSRAGVALQPEAWAFITGIEADTQKPTIIERSPNAQYYVDVSTPIYLIFSEPVKYVSSSTVYIKKQGVAIPLEATVTYHEASHKVEIVPKSPLEDWTVYTVYCTDSLTDNAGNTLDAYQFSFRTDDKNNPSVVHKYPEQNDTNISTNAVITVTFSESIKSYTVTNSSNFRLEKWTGATWEPVSTVIIYNDYSKTATCYPQSLEPNTQYRITLRTDIRDQAHNPLNSEIQWVFATSDEPDTTPPLVSSKTPNENSTNVPVDTQIIVDFSEQVSGVSGESFIVKRSDNNQPVTGNVVYNHPIKQATFTPRLMLDEGVWYTVELTGAIKDTANNALEPVIWQFKTADTTKPYIVAQYPFDGMGNVGSNSNIVVTFSENVMGINAQSFTIYNETIGQYISGSITYNAATYTAIFDPDIDLPFESIFKVTLTNAIKDLNTNSLNQTQWTFETAAQPDTTPPTILSTYPVAGQQNIPVSVSININFNEPVSGVGPQTVMLKEGDVHGPLISCMVNYDAIAKRANVTPNSNLKYDTQYTVIVVGGSGSDIKDFAGNTFAQTVTWSFITTPDTTPPVVTFKSPDEGTPDIPGNAVEVRVIFSEQVQNVTTATFKLIRQADNYEIPSTVYYSYNPQSNLSIATLVPQGNVTISGTYIARLTDGITDISSFNNPLMTTQWTFTITALDETAPTVILKTPDNNATNWNTKKIIVVFSEDVRGVSGSSFYIKDQYNNIVPAGVSYSHGLLTAQLEVIGDVPYETTYTAYLTSAIKDRANNSITPISWSFSTPADNIPPSVNSVYPPDGTLSFPVNGLISATFSEPIQGYSSSSFYLEPAASAQIVYDNQTKKLTLIPNSNLQGNTTYTVHITTAITDRAKVPNPLLNPFRWQFTTQPVPDTTPPQIVAGSRSPAPGANAVPLSTNISVRFTEHVVNAATKIKLQKGSSIIPVDISYNPQTFVATLEPVNYLEQNTVYTVVVEGGPTGILDVAGNYLQNTDMWQFTTEPDVTPPSIVYRYPVSGATNVPLKPVITVTFSESVVGVTSSSFTLTGSNVPVCYVAYDDATRTATLTPGSELQNNATYTVTLFNSIKDRYNNALAQTTWTFTTYSLPQITNIAVSTNGGISYTTISDNATNINRRLTNVRITFNRAMNTQKQWFEIYEGASGTTTPSPLSASGFSWSQDATQITYTLIGQCKASTQYQFKLFGWGGSFEDPDGNRVSRTAYVGDGILNFTTGGDAEAPLVISTIPHNGATNVGRNIDRIIIRFNEMMNQTRDSRITLNPSVTATRQGWIEGGRTVIFTIPQLAANTTYTVTLNAGTNSFQDIAGNNAAGSGAVILNFTTGSQTGSTVLLADGFENYTNPYFTHFRNVTNDNADWERVTTERSGNGTNLTPPQGSYFAKASNWTWNTGNYADVVTINPVNLSIAGTYILQFNMYHERIYNAVDRLMVLISTNGINYHPIDAGPLGPLYRYDWSLSDNNPVWQTHYVDLSSLSGSGTVWIMLRGFSAGEMGQNVIIDNVQLIRY